MRSLFDSFCGTVYAGFQERSLLLHLRNEMAQAAAQAISCGLRLVGTARVTQVLPQRIMSFTFHFLKCVGKYVRWKALRDIRKDSRGAAKVLRTGKGLKYDELKLRVTF